MQIHTHVGISLDGFLATPDGLPAWEAIPTFGPGSYGIAEFMEQCDAVVMGRTSFDQGIQEWLTHWPYAGKQVYVLTSSPLPANAPASVIASKGGPAGLLAQLRDAGLPGPAQLLGGARIIQAFLELGAIDRLGVMRATCASGEGNSAFRGRAYELLERGVGCVADLAVEDCPTAASPSREPPRIPGWRDPTRLLTRLNRFAKIKMNGENDENRRHIPKW
jgi:dihydrofolate reductase